MVSGSPKAVQASPFYVQEALTFIRSYLFSWLLMVWLMWFVLIINNIGTYIFYLYVQFVTCQCFCFPNS